MIVAISGRIGSGKTTLVNSLSYEKFNVDDYIKKLHEKLKTEVFNIFNTNDKKQIFNCILNSSEKEEKLQKLFFPFLVKKLHELENSNHIVVFEMANVLSTGLYKYVDKVVLVNTEVDRCIEHTLNRNYYDKQLILNILDKQQKEYEFVNVVDVVFNTTNCEKADIIRFKELFEIFEKEL